MTIASDAAIAPATPGASQPGSQGAGGMAGLSSGSVAIRATSSSGRRMTHTLTGDQAAHRLNPLELLAAALATRDMRFDQCSIRGVELAVGERAQQQFLIRTGCHHFTLLDCSSAALPGGSNSLARMARPRAKRDMTVPIGRPVISAISA